MTTGSSKNVALAAIHMATTISREDERQLKQALLQKGVRVAAMDFGGEASTAIPKIIERAVVSAKREGVIRDTHVEEGAVAGAAREALAQVASRSFGLNFGGKIGVARQGGHLCVAVFFTIGMIHLDDVAIGLAHRAVLDEE